MKGLMKMSLAIFELMPVMKDLLKYLKRGLRNYNERKQVTCNGCDFSQLVLEKN